MKVERNVAVNEKWNLSIDGLVEGRVYRAEEDQRFGQDDDLYMYVGVKKLVRLQDGRLFDSGVTWLVKSKYREVDAKVVTSE
jgi:hypothetical protein